MNKFRNLFNKNKFALAIDSNLFVTRHPGSQVSDMAKEIGVAGFSYTDKTQAEADAAKLQGHIDDRFGVNNIVVEVVKDHTFSVSDLIVSFAVTVCLMIASAFALTS